MFSEVVSSDDDEAEGEASTVLQELLSNSAGESQEINQKNKLKPLMLTAGSRDSKSIVKINQFLESGLKEGEISNTLYGHLKGEKIYSIFIFL